MLNNSQIKLVHVAARGAGLRDGRYRVLLSQYKQPSGRPVKSSKQLNGRQLDDFLAICESLGWRHPNKGETFYRDRVVKDVYNAGVGSAMIEAIKHLAGDLGMTDENLKKFVLRMTKGRTDVLAFAGQRTAWAIMEALKSMLGPAGW